MSQIKKKFKQDLDNVGDEASEPQVGVGDDDPLRPGWYFDGAPMVCECHPDRWYDDNHAAVCAGPGVSVPTVSYAAAFLAAHPDNPNASDDDLFVVLGSAPGPEPTDGQFVELEARNGHTVSDVHQGRREDGLWVIGPLCRLKPGAS